MLDQPDDLAIVDSDDEHDAPDTAQPSGPVVQWKKPPTVLQLKQDLQDAQIVHNNQKTKIGAWLDNLHMNGKAKITPTKGTARGSSPG
jgi:hypothetical protein